MNAAVKSTLALLVFLLPVLLLLLIVALAYSSGGIGITDEVSSTALPMVTSDKPNSETSQPAKDEVSSTALPMVTFDELNLETIQPPNSETGHVSLSFSESFPSVEWRQYEVKFANLNRSYQMSSPSNLDVCKNASLFVFVPSKPTSFDVRTAIRESWGKLSSDDNIVLRFVIGMHVDHCVLSRLSEEQKQYDDLILYDIEDTYRNLFVKIYASFQWQQTFCSNVPFVLKIDDDSIVDFKRLQYWIEKKVLPLWKENSALIFGNVINGMPVVRNKNNKKYFVSRFLYRQDFYEPYVSGPGYLVSNKAVSGILSTASKIRAFQIEDALFTGVVANAAKIRKENGGRYLKTFSNKVKEREACEGGVPMITLITGVGGTKNIKEKYESLRTVQCE